MMKRIIINSLTLCAFIVASLFVFKFLNPTFFDQPNELSNHLEQIEVGYVNWACDCADFYDLKLFTENPNYKLSADDCIYIEPKDKSHKIPEQYFDTIYRNKNLRLMGQFYIDKGISRSYKMKTSEKPEYSRVFQYESYVLIYKTEINIAK